MTSGSARVALMLAVIGAAELSLRASQAEPAAVCKAGSAQTLTGAISMAPSKEDSIGGWMIVAPLFDDTNACKVMDLVGKGALPQGCAEKARFKASGVVDDAGYALQIKTISCR